MLQPKRTKFRRQQRNNLKGNAQRGNQLAFGSFGIKTLDNKWINSRQLWVADCNPGRILFEIEGVPYEVAKEALRLGAQKLPVQTKFVVRRDYDPELIVL